MGLITDQMVIDAVRSCGTATGPMIYDYLEGHVGDVDRATISSRAGKKLKQLVKYRLICSMEFQKRLWFYMPDTVPDPIPEKPVHGSDKIKDCVKNLPAGGSITVKEAVKIGGCGKSHARRVLSQISCLKYDCREVYHKELA